MTTRLAAGSLSTPSSVAPCCPTRLPLLPLQVAEFLDVPSCTLACAEALCALSNSSFPISTVLALPDEVCIQPAIARLHCNGLLRAFGNALDVMRDPAKLAQLTELSHSAMLALLKSEDLTTDSESTVLLLLRAWYERNRQTCSRERLTQLRAVVRYSALEAIFLSTILHQMPDFNPTQREKRALWIVSCSDETLDTEKLTRCLAACPSSWWLYARPSHAGLGRGFKLQLKVPQAQLSLHLAAVAKMRAGGPPPATIFSERVYGCGYFWDLSFSSDSCETALEVSLGFFFPHEAPGSVSHVDVTSKISGSPLLGAQQSDSVLRSGQRVKLSDEDTICNADVVLGGDDSLIPWLKHLVAGKLCWEAEVNVNMR